MRIGQKTPVIDKVGCLAPALERLVHLALVLVVRGVPTRVMLFLALRDVACMRRLLLVIIAFLLVKHLLNMLCVSLRYLPKYL